MAHYFEQLLQSCHIKYTSYDDTTTSRHIITGRNHISHLCEDINTIPTNTIQLQATTPHLPSLTPANCVDGHWSEEQEEVCVSLPLQDLRG